MTSSVGNVTEKGRVTIPRHLREKYKLHDKVLLIDTAEGVLIKRAPKTSKLNATLKDFKIDLANIRQKERKLEAEREQRLMEIIERARKRRQRLK